MRRSDNHLYQSERLFNAGESMKPIGIAAAGILTLIAASASAQTATQTVTFQVDAINQVGVFGAPSLIINAAVPGSAPTSVASSGHTWSVTTNQTAAKITASIASNMPPGLTLQATLGVGSTGATSAGAKTLSTVAVDMVTAITKVNGAGLTLGYTLDATAAAGVVTSQSRVVTYTITGGT
jgi:hypothetical protein